LSTRERFESIAGDELYRALAVGESVVLVDVRTRDEFGNRHIPGSILIPMHELEERVKEVPNSGTPIAVICEYGQRSYSACGMLAQYGLGPLYNLSGGIRAWPGPVADGLEGNGTHRHGIAPSSFLIDSFDLLPGGLALDLAMGEGRNAIYLATRGFDVDGVDADARRVERARAAARRLGAPIRAIVGNVEDGSYIIPLDAYNVISVFNYLHRPLFKDIKDGVVPGGVVVYQTFTIDHAQYGRPTNPDYLLQPNELREVFSDWEILRHREIAGSSRRDGQMRAIAGIVARKPDPSPT